MINHWQRSFRGRDQELLKNKSVERETKNGNEVDMKTPMKRMSSADKEVMQAYLFSPHSSSSKLRPRKEVPAFRKVDLDENDCDRIVGKRVKVYWSGSRKWFTGCIRGFDSKNRFHFIRYDDGDKEELDLKKEQFELEILPAEGFKLRAEPYSKMKSRGLDGGKSISGLMKEDSDKAGGSEKETNSPEPKKNKAAKKPRRRGTTKSQRKDTESAKAEDTETAKADGSDVEESQNTVEDCSTDVPIAEFMKTYVSSKKRGHADREMVQADLFSPHGSSSKLRPRKEVPAFRMVDLDENDCDRIVGKRVKVYWSGSRKWFTGRIRGFDGKNRLHFILYDDGDKEELDLNKEQFELEILPAEGFKLRAEPYSKMKSRGSDGGKSSSGVVKEDSDKAGGREKETFNSEPKRKKAAKKPGIRRGTKSQRKDTESVKAEDTKTVKADGSDGEESQNTVKDCSTDVPIAEFMKRHLSSKAKGHAAREMVQAHMFSPQRSSSKLRPRKEVPAFRMVDLDENDCNRIVGKRIKVYWSGSRKWFTGRVSGFDGKNRLHFILYDDGDKEELDLKKEQFEIEIMPAEGFKLRAEPYWKMKSRGLDGGKSSSDVIKEDSDKAGGSEKERRSFEPKKEKAAKKPRRRGATKSQRKDDESFKAEDTETVKADGCDGEESRNTVEDCSTDVPIAKLMKRNVSSEKKGMQRAAKRRSSKFQSNKGSNNSEEVGVDMEVDILQLEVKTNTKEGDIDIKDAVEVKYQTEGNNGQALAYMSGKHGFSDQAQANTSHHAAQKNKTSLGDNKVSENEVDKLRKTDNKMASSDAIIGLISNPHSEKDDKKDMPACLEVAHTEKVEKEMISREINFQGSRDIDFLKSDEQMQSVLEVQTDGNYELAVDMQSTSPINLEEYPDVLQRKLKVANAECEKVIKEVSELGWPEISLSKEGEKQQRS